MHRSLMALLLVALAGPGVSWAQDKTQDQQRIAENLRKLEIKMRELVEQLRAKGQETYAAKLEQGLKKLREEFVGVKIQAVIEHLSKNNIERALEAGEQVSRSLEGLIALLEDRTDPEELKKKIAELQNALQKTQEIRKKEEEILKDNEKLNGQMEKEIEQARKDLAELIERQKELRFETESGKPFELIQKMEEMAREIEKLQAEQKGVEKTFDEAKSKELRDVGELAKKLNELIDRQEKARKELEEQASKSSALDR
ncbi:MAG TPA: hypothetical protein VEN81_14250, partial [Planctomycetota bacterium]|nr:hypothetical protein [Planctomycetota bacterium]